MRTVILIGLFSTALAASAATRYVDGNSATPQAPYTTKATAARKISQAVAIAGDRDTILVSTGRYVLSTPIVLSKAIILRAAGAMEDTIVDGNDATRCFKLQNADARLDGFTITRGRALEGAGVYAKNGTILNCTIVSNTAIGLEPRGGGIYTLGLVKNCSILYNTAFSTNTTSENKIVYGGGLFCSGGTIENSGIAYNKGIGRSAWGGGVSMLNARLVHCGVGNNDAEGVVSAYGGGVQAHYGSVIERCWISNNQATTADAPTNAVSVAEGGGINLFTGSSARNSIIVNNTTLSTNGVSSGGGAWISESSLFHCTLAGNDAIGGAKPAKAGGVTWCFNSTCDGSIIWDNAGSGNHTFLVGTDEVDFTYTCTDYLPPGTGNQNEDPQFVKPVWSNYRLQADSPCLDAARPATSYTVDLDGYPRPADGDTNGTSVTDIGCYEFGDVIRPIVCDFDGDGQTDPAVMQAANGRLRLLKSLSWRNWITSCGQAGWIPVPADYDGDTVADPAWYDPVTFRWHIFESDSNYTERAPAPKFGVAGGMPLTADFDGDGKADLTVRQADGKLRIRNSSDGATGTTAQGNAGWIATPADYDGDGKADPAWYQPGDPGKWRIYGSRSGYAALQPVPTYPAGLNALPVLGDFDGDGTTDRAVFIPATGKFKVKESTSGQAWTSALGDPSWKPAPGDYNGDGLTDCAWFIPALKQFRVLYSDLNNADNDAGNSATLPAFGAAATDLPLAYQPGK
jgi:hypothetical protein